jgi:hypothetical protein
MRIRRRYFVAIAVAAAAGMVLVGCPPLRVYLGSRLGLRSSRCLLLGPSGCQHADRIEVRANGVLLEPGGEAGETLGGWARWYVFPPTGDTVFTFRILRDGELLYEEPTYRVAVGPGDIFRCSFEPGEELPPGRFGPAPTGAFPAVAEGVPPKVWSFFRPDDQLRRDRLWVTLREDAAVTAFRQKAWWRGYRTVEAPGATGGKVPRLKLAPPWGRTLVEAWLDLASWQEVDTVRPEVLYVY